MTASCRKCRHEGSDDCENRDELVRDVEDLAPHFGGSALFKRPDLFKCSALRKAIDSAIKQLENAD